MGTDARDPLVMSWGSGRGWHAKFDWVGTRDPTPLLCAPEGLAFLDEDVEGLAEAVEERMASGPPRR